MQAYFTTKREVRNPYLQVQWVYNNDRPHQALKMKYPGEIYVPSLRIIPFMTRSFW